MCFRGHIGGEVKKSAGKMLKWRGFLGRRIENIEMAEGFGAMEREKFGMAEAF